MRDCAMIRMRNQVAFGLLVALAAGCSSGPPAAIPVTGASDRLPADGSAGGPGLPALTTTSIKRADWVKFDDDRLKPSCDARTGSGKADVAPLKAAGDVIAQWMEFHKKPKSGPKTDDGKRLGGGVEPSRVVDTLGRERRAGRELARQDRRGELLEDHVGRVAALNRLKGSTLAHPSY